MIIAIMATVKALTNALLALNIIVWNFAILQIVFDFTHFLNFKIPNTFKIVNVNLILSFAMIFTFYYPKAFYYNIFIV
jgi:hypothetical protein